MKKVIKILSLFVLTSIFIISCDNDKKRKIQKKLKMKRIKMEIKKDDKKDDKKRRTNRKGS